MHSRADSHWSTGMCITLLTFRLNGVWRWLPFFVIGRVISPFPTVSCINSSISSPNGGRGGLRYRLHGRLARSSYVQALWSSRVRRCDHRILCPFISVKMSLLEKAIIVMTGVTVTTVTHGYLLTLNIISARVYSTCCPLVFRNRRQH